ncbi:unnamed protein product [Litomosoides sigmodontis]|uniref:Uncharacterized protein n=1 Tax=Litomosoides sigmodontis TaxID=42156 RepID=A0A3P6TMJ9_LITSI|nr:unnamed protein product [Litomosoides sigmodontis]
MSTKNQSSNEEDLQQSFPICDNQFVNFKYHWTTKVLMRQLNDNESMIIHVSPKFATVHGQVAFQWSLQMRGTTFLNDVIDVNEGISQDEAECEPNYIALSLYFNDGPAPIIDDLQAITKLLQDKRRSTDSNDDDYVDNIGQVISLSITLKLPLQLFEPNTYLNTLTPTPITSFLTANYRARASSKVFNRLSRKNKLLSNMEDNLRRRLSLKQQEDFDEIFNRIMNEEEECCAKSCSGIKFKKCDEARLQARSIYKTVLFKKLLIACCDGCQKRAKILEEENVGGEMDQEENEEVLDDENAFECSEQNKDVVHEMLANMFFTKVALPEMGYVENFADFLFDSEVHNLPVLKRVCEGYLCSELNTKKDLITSLLLELLYLAIVFNLRLLKSMTLSELSTRPEELDEPDALLALDEYKNLDRRMLRLSGSNLTEVIEEVQHFREQRLRIKLVEMN